MGEGTALGAEEQREFWSAEQPGLRFARSAVGTKAFFAETEHTRYTIEPHLREVVGFHRWAGRDVLDAGCGIATDGIQFARAGARYTGVDFTTTALELARKRFEAEGAPGSFVRAALTDLPFADASFDLVYSNGVIHHIPEIERVVREFRRVLRPDGTAMVMVYHRGSFNYRFTIMTLRRGLVALLLLPGASRAVARLTGEHEDVLEGHRTLLRRDGIRYLTDGQLFLSNNTDGPGNPLSKVYRRDEAAALFGRFDNVRTTVRYLNLRLYPAGLQLQRTAVARRLEQRYGWHLWITARKPLTG